MHKECVESKTTRTSREFPAVVAVVAPVWRLVCDGCYNFDQFDYSSSDLEFSADFSSKYDLESSSKLDIKLLVIFLNSFYSLVEANKIPLSMIFN